MARKLVVTPATLSALPAKISRQLLVLALSLGMGSAEVGAAPNTNITVHPVQGATSGTSALDKTVGDFFFYAAPPGWGWMGESSLGLSQKEKGVYGGTLHGPVGGVVPIRISLHYYAAGNLLHDTIEVYVRRFSQPILGPVEGNEYGALRKAIVSGRAATIFERRKNEFVPRPGATEPSDIRPGTDVRREMRADPVPIIERFVVVPGDSGFYALRYTAPAALFAEFLPVFEQVTGSFRALR